MNIDVEQFGKDWQDDWNSHDLTRILSHYADDVVFRSAKAFGHLGMGELHGKDQLRVYWQAALDAQPDLKFDVEQVFAGHQMAVIVYRNHKGVRAAETLLFDVDGQITQASACHDTPPVFEPVSYQVDVWLFPNMAPAFDEFEHHAKRAMARYGGRVVSDLRDPSLPCDVRHIVEFPSHLAFDAYRAGPEAAAMAEDRARIVERTDIRERTKGTDQ